MKVVDGQGSMRGIADALAVFEDSGGLDGDGATIRTMSIGRSERRDIHMVVVKGRVYGEHIAVRLPNALRINARDRFGTACTRNLGELDEAHVSHAGELTLRSGERLHAITLLDLRQPRPWRREDERILGRVLQLIEAFEDCACEVHPDLPDLIAIDYSRVHRFASELKPCSLKSIMYELNKVQFAAGSPEITRHRLSDVLDDAGLRDASRTRRAA